MYNRKISKKFILLMSNQMMGFVWLLVRMRLRKKVNGKWTNK